MKIASWNVNGFRAVMKKGFPEWIRTSGFDVVGLQETRLGVTHEKDISREAFPGWNIAYTTGKKPGYSGVGLFSKLVQEEYTDQLNVPAYDAEARYQMARIRDVWVCNVYFPNGKGKDNDNSRVPFKLKFTQKILKTVEPLLKKEKVIVMGDFNTAPAAIDLARPKTNEKTSGFLPEERVALEQWKEAGMVDAFRHFYPTQEGAYSWWTARGGARANNVGWRIDLTMLSPNAAKALVSAKIHPEVMGSDHCPVSVELRP